MASEDPTSRNYLVRVCNCVIMPSFRLSDGIAGVLAIVVLPYLRSIGASLDPLIMDGLVWQIPCVLFVLAILFRLSLSTYWIHIEDMMVLDSARTELNKEKALRAQEAASTSWGLQRQSRIEGVELVLLNYKESGLRYLENIRRGQRDGGILWKEALRQDVERQLNRSYSLMLDDHVPGLIIPPEIGKQGGALWEDIQRALANLSRILKDKANWPV